MFTNLSKKFILNGQDSNGAYPDNSPLSDGFVYMKFAWEVRISLEGEGGLSSANMLVAKTCDLPKFTFDTQVVNVYNHKTLVQTKMNYEPLSMSFYDQANGQIEKLVMDFVKGQFDPIDGSKTASNTPLTIEIKMKNLSAPDAPPKVYTLLNAYITDVQHDSLDYSSSDPVLWTLTVRYEDLSTADFDQQADPVKAGIPARPKPPKPVETPVVKPPKADAKTSGEAPKDEPMWTDPMGTTDGAAIMAVAGTNSKPKEQKAWPEPLTNNSKYPSNPSTSVSPRPTSSWQAQQVWDSKYASGWNADGTSKNATTYSPSTGTSPTSNTPAKMPDRALSSNQKDFIAREEAATKDAGYNEAWKKAYIEELKKHPPRQDTYTETEIAKKKAELRATVQSPKYPSQTRTVESDGTVVNRSNNNPSAMNSASSNRGQAVSNTQAQREQALQNQRSSKPGGDF